MNRLLAALLMIAAAACSGADGGDDPSAEDARHRAEMAAATSGARAKLDYFWEHLEAPEVDEYDFSLKILLPHGDDTAGEELVWVDDIVRAGQDVNGALMNAPKHQPGLARDDRVTFPADAIQDWAFFRGEELIGHYTTRVMLYLMPTDEAEIMRALLGENPE